MSTADHILDQIDHALGDYELSPDAMRWNPDARPSPAGLGRRFMVATIDTTVITRQFEQLQQAMQAISEAARARCEEIGRAFDSLKQAGICDDQGRPLPPRDRPAWQSPHGPAHQRRR